MVKNNCTFGLVLEQRVKGIEKGFSCFNTRMDKFEKNIDKKLTELFNHQSSHIPQETVDKIATQWKIITILCSLLCVSLGVAGTFVIAMLKFGGV